MAGKFVLNSTFDGRFMFNLKAGDGEIILTSATHAEKSRAQDGIESVRENSQIDDLFDKHIARDNSLYFVLKDGNEEIVGVSEMFSTNSVMDNVIRSVREFAPDATVEYLD